MLFNLCNPILDVVEGFLVCNVIHQQNPLGLTAILQWKKKVPEGYGEMSVLAGCVPNLNVLSPSVQVQCSNFGVNACMSATS